MSLDRNEAEMIARTGASALQAGRPDEARACFERLVAAGQVNAQIRLLLAVSCRALGDRAAEEQTVDAVLGESPDNIRALVMKGDCRQAAADDRAATSFYQAAAKNAAKQPSLPAELKSEVERALREVEANSARYRARLESHLGTASHSERFRESLDLMFGEKEVFFQKPSAYYFPGLPQIQFYDRSAFPWVERVEAATDAIRAELDVVLQEEGLFRPYLKASRDRPNQDFHGMLGNPDWSTLHLFENGATRDIAERCPKTFEAVEAAPLCRITTRAPSILFSLLKAGARIPPHHGMINTRLICHLPLIVPPGCGFRVGNEVRQWEVGKLLVFDDTIEHEAWNEGDEDRVVLIFDVWRPELRVDERRSVAALFEAIDDPQPL